MSEFLVCPRCKVPLLQSGKILHCKNCELDCVSDRGIYDFMGYQGSYWGEIPMYEMENTLKIARENGWRVAARSVSFKYPDLSEYILSNARIDWLFHCLEFSKTDSCLDLGSGWGTIAFALARFYNEVWSLEMVKERIEFQKIRKEQDNISNIKFLRADWLRLPFPDNHFNLVVANGVFEWLGLSDYSKNPRQVQLDFLQEVKRVLKPDGCLYIGTENRFGLQFLLGEKDHSGLPFTGLLPRTLADIVVKLFRKTGGKYTRENRMKEEWESYRTYTYSLWGYKKILKEVRFNQIDLYWTLSYNSPKYAGRFDGESFRLLKLLKTNIVRQRTLASFLTSVGWHLPNFVIKFVFRLVCPSFLIFAYKREKNMTFESKLLQLEGPNCSFMRVSGSHGINSKISYFLVQDSRLYSVLKFPRFNAGTSATQIEEAKMSQFNHLYIRKKVIDSITVFVENAIPGVRCHPYNFSHNLKVLNWLLDFQHKTQRGFWDFNQIEQKITTLSHFLSELPLDNIVRSRTRQSMELLVEYLRELKLPKNSEHGDFFTGNILISDNGTVYVTDWEFYQEEGEPLFDFIFFVLDNSIKGAMPNSLLDNLCDRGKYSPILKALISNFAKAKGFPSKLILQAFPYTILRCIQRAAFEIDNRHTDVAFFINLLESWINYIDDIPLII